MTADTIRNGKMVSLTYTLRNERGEVFEQTDMPVSYLHGQDSGLFEKVERALEGKRTGERIEVSLGPDEGFGQHDPALTFTDSVENVPTELRHLGAQLEAQNPKGEVLTFVVTRIENGMLTVDANHPLAGQTLHFTCTITDARPASEEEVAHGHAHGEHGHHH